MDRELEEYLLRHSSPEPEWLRRLDRDANLELMNPRMNSGHLQGRLLKMLVEIASPRRVLEIGTFGGYSALCMAEGLADGAELITLEIDDEKEDFIRRHLAMSPYGHRVTAVIADAMDYLPEMAAGSVDLIFLDGNKRDYPALYAECKRVLRGGGLLLADNVLWNGHITDPRYDRDAQTVAVRKFNELCAADPDMDAVILPVRDGLAILRKKEIKGS